MMDIIFLITFLCVNLLVGTSFVANNPLGNSSDNVKDVIDFEYGSARDFNPERNNFGYVKDLRDKAAENRDFDQFKLGDNEYDWYPETDEEELIIKDHGETLLKRFKHLSGRSKGILPVSLALAALFGIWNTGLLSSSADNAIPFQDQRSTLSNELLSAQRTDVGKHLVPAQSELNLVGDGKTKNISKNRAGLDVSEGYASSSYEITSIVLKEELHSAEAELGECIYRLGRMKEPLKNSAERSRKFDEEMRHEVLKKEIQYLVQKLNDTDKNEPTGTASDFRVVNAKDDEDKGTFNDLFYPIFSRALLPIVADLVSSLRHTSSIRTSGAYRDKFYIDTDSLRDPLSGEESPYKLIQVQKILGAGSGGVVFKGRYCAEDGSIIRGEEPFALKVLYANIQYKNQQGILDKFLSGETIVSTTLRENGITGNSKEECEKLKILIPLKVGNIVINDNLLADKNGNVSCSSRENGRKRRLLVKKDLLIFPLMYSDLNHAVIRFNADHRYSVLNDAFRTIVKTIKSLHDLNLVHMDISSGNILVSENASPYLGDFGLSAKIGDSRYLTNIPPHLLDADGAEAKRKNIADPCSPEYDSYRLGLTFLTLASGNKKFNGDVSGDIRPAVAKMHLPPTMKEILHKLLDPERRNRPTVSDLLKMYPDYFSDRL